MKFIRNTVLIISIVGFMAGCGKKTTQVTVPGGSMEITKEGKNQGEVKITTKEGTMEFSANKKVDLSTLGIPIYPGLTADESGSMAASGTKENQQMQMVNLVSSDPSEKVVAFYKEQLKNKKPNIMEMNSSGKKMTHIIVEENKQVMTLIITEDKGKTKIVFYKGSK